MAAKTNGMFALVKQAGKDFMDDECPTRAAALAYYTVFALPSLLVLILLVAGMVWDPQDFQEKLQGQLGQVLPEAGREEVGTMMQQAERPDTGRPLAAAIGIGMLVFGATGAFMQLQGALNRAWEVKPDPEQGGIKNFIFKRLLSLGFILGIAFLLLVSMALSVALQQLGQVMGTVGIVGEIINNVVSLVVITLLFAAIFKVLPDARIAWRDVWVGAFVTAVLFTIGKFALGMYLSRSNPGDAFGAAGSLAVLLVWIYYASMIVLFGAEFTQTWAERRGSGITPEEGAVRVVEEEKVVEKGSDKDAQRKRA